MEKATLTQVRQLFNLFAEDCKKLNLIPEGCSMVLREHAPGGSGRLFRIELKAGPEHNGAEEPLFGSGWWQGASEAYHGILRLRQGLDAEILFVNAARAIGAPKSQHHVTLSFAAAEYAYECIRIHRDRTDPRYIEIRAAVEKAR